MMQAKKIIIDVSPTKGYKGMRKYYVLSGSIFIVLLALVIAFDFANQDAETLFEPQLIVYGGPLFVGMFFYVKESRFIPKIEISSEAIKIKKSWIKRSKTFDGSKIEKIKLASYQIDFQFKDGSNFLFDYERNADVSKEIKTALREFAEENGIHISY